MILLGVLLANKLYFLLKSRPSTDSNTLQLKCSGVGLTNNGLRGSSNVHMLISAPRYAGMATSVVLVEYIQGLSVYKQKAFSHQSLSTWVSTLGKPGAVTGCALICQFCVHTLHHFTFV